MSYRGKEIDMGGLPRQDAITYEILSHMPRKPLVNTIYPPPTICPSTFDDLLEMRNRISLLHVTPVKSDEEWRRYCKDRETGDPMAETSALINAMPAGCRFLMTKNAYPYDLPIDTQQLIFWCKKNVEADSWTIAKALGGFAAAYGISPSEMIVTRRPVEPDPCKRVYMLHGSEPRYPHHHIFTRDNPGLSDFTHQYL